MVPEAPQVEGHVTAGFDTDKESLTGLDDYLIPRASSVNGGVAND